MPDFREQFSQFMDQQPSAAAGTPAVSDFKSEFSTFMDQQAEQERALRQSMAAVGKVTPEQAAQRQYLSKVTGIPVSLMDSAEGEAKAMAKFQELQQAAAYSPVLRAKLQNPEFLSLAQDEPGLLSQIERQVGSTFAYLMGNGPGDGIIGTIKAMPFRGAAMAEGVYRAAAKLNGLDQWADYFGNQAKEFDARAKELAPPSEQFVLSAVQSGVESFLQYAKYLPLAMLPGGQPLALAGMGAEAFGATYNKTADKGRGDGMAMLHGASDAAIEIATEMGPLGSLVHSIKVGTPLFTAWLKNAWAENKGEQVATFLQDLNDWAVNERNEGKSIGDFLSERPRAAAQTFLATLVGAGGNVMLSEAVQKGLDQHYEWSREAYLKDQEKRAEAFTQNLAALQKTMESSKLLERSPDTMRTFAQDLMDSEGVGSFYFDPVKLREAGVDLQQLAQELPSVASQLDAAMAGSDIVVPAGEFLTNTIGSTFNQPLIDNARPDVSTSMSRAEAQEWMSSHGNEVKAEIDRVLAQKEVDQGFQQSKQVVHQQLLEEIKAMVRFSPQQAKQFATLASTMYAVTAAQMGVTPEQLAQTYKLGFTNQELSRQSYDQNGNLITDTPNFKNWFGDSKVVDDQGKPRVMYHGTNARKDFSQFRPGDEYQWGSAMYFSPNAEYSNGYTDRGYYDEEMKPGEAGDRILPVYLSVQNLFEPEKNPEHKALYSKWAEEQRQIKPVGPDYVYGPENPVNPEMPGLIDYRDQWWLADRIKAAGFDGFTTSESDGSTIAIGVFSDKQIKSVFNNGNFDPNDANILNQGAKVDKLQMVAQRGERAVGSRATFTAEEKAAIEKSAEDVGISVKEITSVVRGHKLAHPPSQGWAPLIFKRVTFKEDEATGKKKISYEYQNIPYDFNTLRDGNALKPGTPEYERRANAVARAMVDEVRTVYRRAQNGDKNAQNIIAQASWYKSMRTKLRQEFGGLGDLFADLLGATSPNTPVRDNWTNAVDALRRASRGDFDELMPKWEAWADKIDQLELDARGYFNERLAEGLTKKAIKNLPEYQAKLKELRAARELPADMLPTKESGKKYGFNGRNVARAMVDLWRVVKNADPDIARGDTAPKALNFSGNLIGFRERATIDVWAARMLQRLAGGMRIPSMAEVGVSGAMREDGSTTLQFGFGQDVFSKGVAGIRADAELAADKTLAQINDDDLQALVWFVEKEVWTVNNWTSAAGEGGSFELEAALTGPKDQEKIRKLRQIVDSSKSTEEAKKKAKDELASLERSVDRFVGGLSIQMSMDTQGVDFVPTDSDMARLANEIRTAIYESDDGATVLASKALSTEGRYGGVERSLDLEVVTREGYDANALWLEMLRKAQEAKQDSTFLSRVLREHEEVDPKRHRPGVEIYFREAASREKLEQMLGELAKEGVEFLTVIVDGRRMTGATEGEMPPAVGVRLQYVPEFEQRYGMDNLSGLTDEQIAEKMNKRAAELDELAHRVSLSVEGVSFASQFWYDTQVAFSHEYQEKIDALTTGTVEAERGQAGAAAPWSGQPVLAGVESANRQSREAARGEPDGGGGTVLDGNAAGSDGTGPTLNQDKRGQIGFPQHGLRNGKTLIAALESADLSTIPHELGHFFWEMRFDIAAQMEAKLQAGEQLTDGEQQILNDVNKGLEWAGLKAEEGLTLLQTWFAMTDEEVTPYHEKLARGLEAYLMEGKSPNLELRRLFQTFRAWLIGVYKSLTGSDNPSATATGEALDVKLTPEFRQVMDRMVATAEEIEVAEAANAMGPLFKTSEEGGMDMDAYKLYQQLGLQHTKDAIDYLQAASLRDLQWLKNAQSKLLKQMQAKHDEVRGQVRSVVEADVMAQPVMKAKAMLDEARKLVGQDTPEFDIALQSAAEANGFPTVEQMLRDIKEFGNPTEQIDALTDQRMLQEHGELSTPEGLQRTVNEAIYNEARARFVATELRALQHAMSVRQKVPGQRATVDVLAQAAREYATEIIGKLQVGQIQPLQYVRAAARNGKSAERATGDLEKQVEFKRNQLINTWAAKIAYEAKREVQKMEAFFKTVANSKDSKDRDMDIVNAARAVVAAFGYGSEKKGLKALEYLEKVKSYDPEMYEILRESVDAATGMAKPGKQLTLEEMRQVYNEVEALWYKSRRLREMEIDGVKMDRDAVADQLSAEVDKIPGGKEVGKHSAPTEADERRSAFSSAKAVLRRVESWVDSLDGGKMGDFRRFIWQPVKEAADKYRSQKIEYIKRFRDGFYGIADTFTKGNIYSQSLDYTFGNESGGVAMNEILHAILHTGNESNKRKLLLGRDWATERADGSLDTSRWDAFMRELVDSGKLTKAHMDWVQSVWDLLEDLKPAAQRAHRDAYGKYFAEITANPVVIPGAESWGVYRGGYVPAMADSRIVKDQELKKLIEAGKESMAYAFPGTSRGFTRGRVEYNRPLLLDLRTLPQHIDRVLLFSNMENPVRDVSMLLSNRGLAERLNQRDPGAINHMLTPWLNRAAQQRVSTPITGMGWANRFLSGMRNRASLASMFANVSNAAQQITGFSLAAVKVRPALLLQATADYLKSPKKMTDMVAESSEYMAHRMDNEAGALRDDIEKILLDPNLYERGQDWAKRHVYFMQSAVDNVMGPIIWTAAYNQAQEQGLSDKDAARMADAAVRQTQGSSLPEDVSRIETGHPFLRLFTQFAGYFNMQANLLGTEFNVLARDIGLRKGMGKGLMILTLGFAVPAILSEAIAQAFRGGPDDDDKDGEYLDDWLRAVFFYGPLKNLTAMVPGAGQLVNTAVARFNHNPADDKMSLSPAVSMVESAASVPVDLYKVAVGEANAQKTVRDLATLITLTTGLPASVAARPLGYLAGEWQGKVNPTSPADQVRGLVTGTASPPSKVH